MPAQATHTAWASSGLGSTLIAAHEVRLPRKAVAFPRIGTREMAGGRRECGAGGSRARRGRRPPERGVPVTKEELLRKAPGNGARGWKPG